MEFTADQVWGLAVAADRINGGYVKFDVRSADGLFISKEANKQVVKRWLREGAVTEATEEDIEQGREVRRHFNSYTFLALQGRLNEFQHTALKLAQKEQFTGRDTYDFAVISCLPDVARRDRKDREFQGLLRESQPIAGSDGDRVSGHVTVDRIRYSHEYNKFMITARMGESFVEFWFDRELKPENSYAIKARIKRQKANHITQLNYVKVVG
jgi:hypothetical protein